MKTRKIKEPLTWCRTCGGTIWDGDDLMAHGLVHDVVDGPLEAPTVPLVAAPPRSARRKGTVQRG